ASARTRPTRTSRRACPALRRARPPQGPPRRPARTGRAGKAIRRPARQQKSSSLQDGRRQPRERLGEGVDVIGQQTAVVIGDLLVVDEALLQRAVAREVLLQDGVARFDLGGELLAVLRALREILDECV